MRAFKFLPLAVFSTLLMCSALLCAQEPKQDDKSPRQEEPKQAEPRQGEPRQAEPRQAEPRPGEPRQAEPRQQTRQDETSNRRQDETRPSKPERQEPRRDERQSQDQMRPAQQERGQQQGHARPSGKSARIPDDRFHAQFGRSHSFPVRRTTVVEGQQGFVYGGYTFVLVDAWPSDWAYTDDCYVDYVDGDYFLFDLLHPGMRIALFVVE